MFVSRRFGRSVASIRVRPVTVLVWAGLLLAFGLVFVLRALQILFVERPPEPAKPLAGIAVGFMLLMVGVLFGSAAIRHLTRALRTFFS
jgi:hypothetical protein